MFQYRAVLPTLWRTKTVSMEREHHEKKNKMGFERGVEDDAMRCDANGVFRYVRDRRIYKTEKRNDPGIHRIYRDERITTYCISVLMDGVEWNDMRRCLLERT